MKSLKPVIACLALAGASVTASAADTYVNVSVGGQVSPGVYGRVDIGNAPPPAVYTSVPVIIQQPVVVGVPGQVIVNPAQPVYLHVPPGHRKKWAKHCHKYNACAAPVYFVRVDGQGRLLPARDHDHHGGGHGRSQKHGHEHKQGRGKD